MPGADVYDQAGIRIIQGDCLDVLPDLPADHLDAVITDPPYGLNFMGANWDHGVPGVQFWAAVRRGGIVLDPFAWTGTTLIAAGMANCRAIGIEQDPIHCQIAAGRLALPLGF